MIKLFRINTGSSGACDAEIESAVFLNRDFAWAADPFEADLLLLTGPLTVASKPAFLAVWKGLSGVTPLLAVGRSAIDGHPYGRGGLAENPTIAATAKLDGDPPTPEAIATAIRAAVGRGTSKPTS